MVPTVVPVLAPSIPRRGSLGGPKGGIPHLWDGVGGSSPWVSTRGVPFVVEEKKHVWIYQVTTPSRIPTSTDVTVRDECNLTRLRGVTAKDGRGSPSDTHYSSKERKNEPSVVKNKEGLHFFLICIHIYILIKIYIHTYILRQEYNDVSLLDSDH